MCLFAAFLFLLLVVKNKKAAQEEEDWEKKQFPAVSGHSFFVAVVGFVVVFLQ